MTAQMTTNQQLNHHGAGTVARRAVQTLKRNFPEWVCWYGPTTKTWWGMAPRSFWYPPLVEAATAVELALRIRQLSAAERRVSRF
ncbi:MAG TPA: hypothetical protein VF069_28185 [Streptosporangiaceae bacterium]